MECDWSVSESDDRSALREDFQVNTDSDIECVQYAVVSRFNATLYELRYIYVLSMGTRSLSTVTEFCNDVNLR